jgi:dihydrodipicolinate synthase/N-acetylneuraminate lyase
MPGEFSQLVNYTHDDFTKAAAIQLKLLDLMNALFEKAVLRPQGSP